MKMPPVLLTALLLRVRRALGDCVTSLESRLKRQAVAMLAATAFCISGSALYAKDTPKPPSPEPPELSGELRVSLREVRAVPTRRAKFEYTFEVKEVIKGVEAAGRGSSVRVSIPHAADVDDRKRDAIDRLDSFFGRFTTFDVAEQALATWLHTVRKTETVNVKIFGQQAHQQVWLFQDDEGRKVAVARGTWSPEWKSKKVAEHFGVTNLQPLKSKPLPREKVSEHSDGTNPGIPPPAQTGAKSSEANSPR
jgi:hypothetical protein